LSVDRQPADDQPERRDDDRRYQQQPVSLAAGQVRPGARMASAVPQATASTVAPRANETVLRTALQNNGSANSVRYAARVNVPPGR